MIFQVILSAFLAIAAFNSGLYWLIFISLVPLFLFLMEVRDWKELILGTFLFRLIFALGTMYFVVDPFLFGTSLIFYMAFPVSIILIRRSAGQRFVPWLLPVIWVIWDYLEAQYTALPMTIAMVGNVLGSSPFIGLSRFGGIVGLTLFVAVVNIFAALAWKYRKNKIPAFRFAAAALILLAVGWFASLAIIRKNGEDYMKLKNTSLITLVSTRNARAGLDNFVNLLPLPQNSSMIVLPETLYRSNFENAEEVRLHYQKMAGSLGNDILATLSYPDSRDGKIYKNSMLFSADGKVISEYRKNVLTITSEYWPFGSWKPFYFNELDFPPDQRDKAVFDAKYQFGNGVPSLMKNGNYVFASPICLELHYPGYLNKLNNLNPDFFLHNSNNDWMTVGLDQYLRLTNNLRAIEAVNFGKPFLISGISDYAGIIYPDGVRSLVYPEKEQVISEVLVRF